MPAAAEANSARARVLPQAAKPTAAHRPEARSLVKPRALPSTEAHHLKAVAAATDGEASEPDTSGVAGHLAVDRGREAKKAALLLQRRAPSRAKAGNSKEVGVAAVVAVGSEAEGSAVVSAEDSAEASFAAAVVVSVEDGAGSVEVAAADAEGHAAVGEVPTFPTQEKAQLRITQNRRRKRKNANNQMNLGKERKARKNMK